jgi:hypothetical protein
LCSWRSPAGKGVVNIKIHTFGASALLIFLLLIPFTAAADADEWGKALVKAAETNSNWDPQKPYDGLSCNDYCNKYYGPNSSWQVVSSRCICQCKQGFEEKFSSTSILYRRCVPYIDPCSQQCTVFQAGRIHGANAYGQRVNGACECMCRDGYTPNKNLECVLAFSDDDAVWAAFQDKCGNLNEFIRGKGEAFTVTQQEFINYLKKVEESNPDASWKQIIAALHVNRYQDDAFSQTLPLTNIHLFEWGPETDGWRDVDLLCKAPIGSISNPDWYTPKFVLTDDGRKVELGHAYGALRVGLDRKDGIVGTFTKLTTGRNLVKDQWVGILTHYGDLWQVVIHNWILREEGDRFPPDQVFGNNMGIWLVEYYRMNPDAPLSKAFQEYFNR